MISLIDYTAFVKVGNETVPVIGLRSVCFRGERGSVVIIYGGGSDASDENLRFTVADSLGVKLVELGFNVYCFDFRSNLDISRFNKFGLYDRYEDVREVIRWVLEVEKTQLSLVGVSMGGPLAVKAALEFSGRVKDLFLIAPAAYHRDAMKPEVKFGPDFSGAIGKGKPEEKWRESDSFDEISSIKADTGVLVIKFRDDKIITKQPDVYFDNISSRSFFERPVRLDILEGPHNGNFTNPERQKDIVRAIRQFLALPQLARD
jgi:dienelactone hydrolase